MNITNKTVLITGGGSGIGFEIAKQLSGKGNRVIITGRNEEKLKKAVAQLNGVSYIAADVNNDDDTTRVVNYLASNFNGLDILINNAGYAHLYQLDGDTARKAGEEIKTNYLSVVELTSKVLPLLKQSTEAAIVNVTSVLAILPATVIATYSASKAALRSYTQALRHELGKTTSIKVFELLPPLVNTELSAGIGGANGIPPSEVADSLLNAFEQDIYEIHTGNTAYIYNLSRTAPADAFKALNEDREV